MRRIGPYLPSVLATLLVICFPSLAHAEPHGGEASLVLPDLGSVTVLGMPGSQLLMLGLIVAALGVVFGLVTLNQVKNLPVHKSMSDVSQVIWETCKTYLFQQGRFLMMLELLVGAIIVIYFGFLQHMGAGRVLIVLAFSIIGILGSYGVAWFGIRINTYANSRTAFASLNGKPYGVYAIPLRAGMSIGMLLISVELLLMLGILLFVPGDYAGSCFIGFTIGESLGASALRIAGGIFTKIADIGSDLMKIVFNIKEDDARNPGVIADCTGDNAGDSVGPTADGFETYGVTGVALITFILVALPSMHLTGSYYDAQGNVIDWGIWTREERDFYREAARTAGVRVVLCVLDPPFQEVQRRLVLRNADRPPGVFHITTADMERGARFWQPPTPEELALFDTEGA